MDRDPAGTAAKLLAPHVRSIVQRINVDQFTTLELIEAMRLDPEAKSAFETALSIIPETEESRSRMILHGQIIPDLLRASKLVAWDGYAYGHEDPHGVPAWWRKVEPE